MILITGATGFVGRHLAARLAEAGLPVRGAARHRSDRLPAAIDFVQADLTQPETLPAALEAVTTIIHAAAITADNKEPYRGAYRRVNAEGTANLVAAAKTAGVRRMIVMSGLGTRPAPAGTYLATRWAMEEAVRHSGISHLFLQPSILFGSGAPFVSALSGLIRTSPVVPVIGSGALLMQPLWIQDLATCVVKALDRPDLEGAIALGGGEQLTFRDLLKSLCSALGRRRLILPLPIPIARIQARLMTAVLSDPPLTPAALELFDFPNVTDLDSVERNFGFQPRGFRAHLREHGIEG